jgi:hypothetical protein
MPGGSVTKIGGIYKKWTYIGRKQNIQLTKKQHTTHEKEQRTPQEIVAGCEIRRSCGPEMKFYAA